MSTDESSFEQFESEYRPRFNTLVARINDLNLGLTREGASLVQHAVCSTIIVSASCSMFCVISTDRRPEVIKTCENDVFEMNNLVRLARVVSLWSPIS